ANRRRAERRLPLRACARLRQRRGAPLLRRRRQLNLRRHRATPRSSRGRSHRTAPGRRKLILQRSPFAEAPRLARSARWWVAGSGRNRCTGPVTYTLLLRLDLSDGAGSRVLNGALVPAVEARQLAARV